MLWTKGFSMIWTIISGLDKSCRCIWLWSSEKLVVFKPKLLRPASPPSPPTPKELLQLLGVSRQALHKRLKKRELPRNAPGE